MSSTTTMDLFSLSGRTALLTGGTRGIGASLALALAEAGADIILIQRPGSTNTSTKTAVEALGRNCTIYHADLARKEDLKGLVEKITKVDGHDISILVSCGGIQRRHPAHQFPDEDWEEVLQVNLTAVFTLMRDVSAYMLTRSPNTEEGKRWQRGNIINIASLVSFQGGLNVPAYAAAKGGVVQVTKSFANQLASQGINVNAIAPGYIATEMNTALLNDEARAKSILDRIPAGRWGTPEDFKGAVVFLAGTASAYVHAECLVVDGGWMGR